ncbi:hypothetical protein FKM82_022469 [Ascaphus truei]
MQGRPQQNSLHCITDCIHGNLAWSLPQSFVFNCKLTVPACVQHCVYCQCHSERRKTPKLPATHCSSLAQSVLHWYRGGQLQQQLRIPG